MEKSGTQQYNNAKIWQIGLFSLNNAATNLALFLMMQYSYFTQNVLGLVAVVIGLILTFTRVFDGITDPIMGFIVDKTKGRFGRFRPFMLVGNIVICLTLLAIFNTPTHWSSGAKYVYTTALYFVYVLGYTCQTICTKAGQAVLTNNPKQRPIFSGFDGVLTTLISALVPLLLTSILAGKYSTGAFAPDKGLINPAMWKEAVIIICAVSFVFTILAIIGIWRKDQPEFYANASGSQKVRFRDYLDILCHNRPIQMLSLIHICADPPASSCAPGGCGGKYVVWDSRADQRGTVCKPDIRRSSCHGRCLWFFDGFWRTFHSGADSRCFERGPRLLWSLPRGESGTGGDCRGIIDAVGSFISQIISSNCGMRLQSDRNRDIMKNRESTRNVRYAARKLCDFDNVD